MIVALMLIVALCWLFYRYSGAQWEKLNDFFFNWETLDGNWWILWQGLEVTLLLAFISGVGSVCGWLADCSSSHLAQSNAEFLFEDLC